VSHTEDPPGPPPPPWERRRRSRRRALLVAVVVAIVVALPTAVLLLPGASDDTSPVAGEDETTDPDGPDEDAAPDAGGEEASPDPDADPPPPDDLDVPDVSDLTGVDRVLAELLIDVDVAERAMIGFQDGIAEEIDAPGDGGGDLLARFSAVAAEGVARLTDARERLTDPLDVGSAEEIRAAYVEHLDAWVEYMRVVEEDPSRLAVEDELSGHTLRINTSASAFERALEEELPEGIDPEVAAFAEGILDRGFRVEFEPQA